MEPNPTEPTDTHRRWLAACVTACAIVGLLASPFIWAPLDAPPRIIAIQAPSAIEDRPDPSIAAATFSAYLVQLGTTRPFTGHGAPGIYILAAGAGSVVDWTLEGWANETTQPAFPTCHSRSIHFTAYDWSSGSSNQGATFTTTPSTVPARLGPEGDQCLARAGATGPWEIHVCAEGIGPDDKPNPDGTLGGAPRGFYYWEGHLRHDAWDHCETTTVQVGP